MASARTRLVPLLALATLVGLPRSPAGAEPSETSSNAVLLALEDAFAQLYSDRAAAVVRVKVASTAVSSDDGENKVSLAVFSGFFVSADGLVVSNALPDKNVTRIWIERQGQSYLAEAIGSDERSNISLLRVGSLPGPVSFVPLRGDAPRPRIGSIALSITSPLDFAPTPGWGLVTGHESGFGQLAFPFTYTRVSIPVGPAEGGSPVFGSNGELIGISVATLPEVNSGYLVPAKALQRIVADLEASGRVRHSDPHFRLEQRPTAPNGPRQVIIASVESGSQAANQKIQPGDTLVRIGDTRIESVDQARDLIFFSDPGSFLPFTISRNGKELDFALLLDNASDPQP